eukprot:3501286-Pleurochrysis_carterae.AAC.1
MRGAARRARMRWRWPLEKCASLADTTGTRELLKMSMETHLHVTWQCLNLRKQRRHLPTQIGKA